MRAKGEKTMAVQHLISNKGRGAHAACDRRVTARLVERVGEVTCKRCLAVLETLRTALRAPTHPGKFSLHDPDPT